MSRRARRVATANVGGGYDSAVGVRMAKPPHSRLGRLARLGGLTSRVSGSYLGQQVKGLLQSDEDRERSLRALHIDNARKVAETMGQLKGAAMKVGQSLALALEGTELPDEVAGALRKLNDKGEPIEFAIIREDVERSLERPLTEAFATFDPDPIGSASLGQAHAATLHDGRDVVVKVLHRGIEGSVASDLGALKAMFVSGRILRRDRAEVEEIFDEIRDRIEEELDYYSEAANLEYFAGAFASDKGIKVPRSVPSHSTDRVLTMERLPGVGIDAFLERATPKAKQRAGLALARSFHVMTYDLRKLHADPHAGNYLFEDDGTVGILDFGCVKQIDLYAIGGYARLALACLDGDRPAAIQRAKDVGFLASDRPEAEEVLWEICEVIRKPFTSGPYTAGAGDDNVQKHLKDLGPRILRYPELRTVKELIYVHRALGGIYALLRRMHTRADWGALTRPYLELAVARADGRAPEAGPWDLRT